MLLLRPLLCLLATVSLAGCGKRHAPAYAEPAPCPYDNSAPVQYESAPPPSSPKSQPVLVSPASFEAPAPVERVPPSCEGYRLCGGET